MSQSNQIANTILAQIGGLTFMRNVGMSNIVVLDKGVQFDINPAAMDMPPRHGINRLRIEMESGKMYVMKFIQEDNLLEKTVRTETKVYSDELTYLFNVHVRGIKSCTG